MRSLLGGRYRLGEVLGAGGMGQVYDATDERLGRRVAVKVLDRDLARQPEVRRRFDQEARAAARLTHPNVVTVFDTGHDAGDSFLVMERCAGGTLADEMRAGPLPEPRLRQVAQQVAAALAAAHDAGIVHRDIKPSNVLVADDARLKVADFGIAKTLDALDVTIGPHYGTPAYAAPERLAHGVSTPASDVWSLGVLLYEAATGDRPLPGAPHPLPDLRADVDPAFAALVARMLQSDPAARPHDGGSVLAGLTSTATIGTTRASTRTVAIDRSGTAGDAHPDQAATHRLHLAEPRRLEPTATMPVTTPSTPAPPRPVREPVARSRRPWRVVAPVVVALAVGAVGVGILLTTGNRDPGTGATPTITEPAPAAPTGATSVSAAPSTLPSPVERDLRRLERAVQP